MFHVEHYKMNELAYKNRNQSLIKRYTYKVKAERYKVKSKG